MEKLFYQLIKQSKTLIEKARKNLESTSENRVFWEVNRVGAIAAYVFNNERGIVCAKPVYDDYGGFALRLAYPATKKIIELYSKKTKISHVVLKSDDFIAFALGIFKTKDGGWEATHTPWTHTYSRSKGIIYTSIQDAINGIYTEDVFCNQPHP